MAKRVESYLVDDFDGSKPAETVSFGFKGDNYEIDLAEHNAREFEKDLARYIEAGRRVAGRNGRNGRRSEQRHQKLQAARVWLRQQGHDISDRGRIPRNLLQKFEAAQGHGG
jgi:hypothetical protein